MSDFSDFEFPGTEMNISRSANEPEFPASGKGNGTAIGGEHLKLILLSAMFSLSILVSLFDSSMLSQERLLHINTHANTHSHTHTHKHTHTHTHFFSHSNIKPAKTRLPPTIPEGNKALSHSKHRHTYIHTHLQNTHTHTHAHTHTRTYYIFSFSFFSERLLL